MPKIKKKEIRRQESEVVVISQLSLAIGEKDQQMTIDKCQSSIPQHSSTPKLDEFLIS